MTTGHECQKPAAPQDFWAVLLLTTHSRIGLGRAGDSLPTRHVLKLKAAHASARDAVHEPLDADGLTGRVASVGIGRPVIVTSQASSRSKQLRRPDLGRLPMDVTEIDTAGEDIGIVLADGLSRAHLPITGWGCSRRWSPNYAPATRSRGRYRHSGPGRVG